MKQKGASQNIIPNAFFIGNKHTSKCKDEYRGSTSQMLSKKKKKKDKDVMPPTASDAIVCQWATKIAQHKQTAKMLWFTVFHNMAHFNNLWLNAISMQKSWDVYLVINNCQ